jgi:putative ABC transport system permease protein
MIPIKYNIRNLRVRWVTTLMTVVGTTLVVWATVLTFGMIDGLEHALRVSGDKLDLVVLRQGSDNETGSSIDPQVAREVCNLPGIAKNAAGEPICSAEHVTILTKPRRGDGGTVNLIVRGLEPAGRILRPNFEIVEGRDVQPGLNEVITSRAMAARFENLGLGEQLEINKVLFNVVGYFEAGGSAAESEVWTALDDLTSARRTPGAISVVNLRCQDDAAKESLSETLKSDERFKLKSVSEADYFEEQMSASIFLRSIGFLIGGFLTFGAMFGAANTMYAAVANRAREIGTLRAIGFSRGSILGSFLIESVLLCLLGGILGCLATLPFNGLSTGTANWATFSEITFSFRFGPSVLARGLLMALAMGLLGGLFPAIRAVRMRIVDALRQA